MVGPDRSLLLARRSRAVAVFLLILLSCSTSARCGVSVQGTAAAVRIEASKARLSVVLGTLGTNFKVRHDTFIALDEVIISGIYSGTLEEVLSRVLTGLNYVIKTKDGTVEVIIVGRSADVPAVAGNAAAALPTNTNPATQWPRSALQKP